MEGCGMANILGTIRPLVFDHCFGCPFCILIGVALIAGIGSAKFHGVVRTRNSDAVVAAIIDAHVSFMGHVTLNTLGSLCA